MTDSNSNSPILPSAIALASPACPKPSFVRGPKSSMPKVEDVIIWLCWAVDPASALQVLLLPLLLALPTHFLLPPVRPSGHIPSPLPAPLPSYPYPGALSAVVARPELIPTTQLYLKGLSDLALLAYSVVLFSFLRLMLVRRWDTEGGEVGAVWGAGVYFLVVKGVHTPALSPQCRLSTTPASALKSRMPHFWLDGSCPEFLFLSTRASVRRLARSRVECGCAACAGPQSLTCQIVLVPRRLGVFPIRAVRFLCTCFFFWTHFVPRVFPDPDGMRVPITEALRWALFSSTLNRVSRCGRGASTCARFTGPGHVYAQRPVNRYR
ncbi:hypothetical protein B0H13DRAFT_1915485 [Mycena leptocephala]|nr:hypothetical protein B0H13DRAFT_1915485 [Mycena leptocephala]